MFQESKEISITKDKTVSNIKIDYDGVIVHIGGFGRYQRRIYLLLCLPLLLCAFHIIAGVFLEAQTDFRCLLPHESAENSTYQLSSNITNLAYPWDNKTQSWSRCERYEVHFTNPYYALDGNLSSITSSIKCDSFVYDKSTYKLTTVTEFNLVCDRAWLKTAADSVFMVGVMLGAIIFGGMSDKYGRRPIFFLCLIMNLFFGLLIAASSEIISYIILRLIVGSSSYGLFLIVYVTALEMVSPKRRLLAGIGMDIFFTIGYLITSGLAYFITNWRILQLAMVIPNLTFLVYWWYIPESARWLITKGRTAEAKGILMKASLENGVELSRDMLDSMLNNHRPSKPDLKKSSVLDLLRYPSLRRKSLLLFFNRLVISCTYYGLSWNTSSLGGNNYANAAISGLVEVPACLFVLFTSNKWGRRIILCCSLLVAGVFLLLTILVPTDMSWLMILFTMIGKLAITASLTTGHIITAELYPTMIRNVGVGACSTCAQIGGAIAPVIISLSTMWAPLPVVIFGSCSLVAGLSSLLLPETLNNKLPDSIEESERLGRRE